MDKPSALIRHSSSTSGCTATTSRTTGPASYPSRSSHTTTLPVPPQASHHSSPTKATTPTLRCIRNMTSRLPTPVSSLLTWTSCMRNSIHTWPMLRNAIKELQTLGDCQPVGSILGKWELRLFISVAHTNIYGSVWTHLHPSVV